MVIFWIYSYLLVSSFSKHIDQDRDLGLNFDRIEYDENKEIACYYFSINSYANWEKLELYTNPNDDEESIYTSITNALYHDCEIRPSIFNYDVVISKEHGAGISVTKKKGQKHGQQKEVYFCIDYDPNDEYELHQDGVYCGQYESKNKRDMWEF